MFKLFLLSLLVMFGLVQVISLLYGSHGYFALQNQQKQVRILETIRHDVQQDTADKADMVARMSSGSIDRDLLEELAHSQLFLSHDSEVIIALPQVAVPQVDLPQVAVPQVNMPQASTAKVLKTSGNAMSDSRYPHSSPSQPQPNATDDDDEL